MGVILLLVTISSASAQERFPDPDGKLLHPRDFASPGNIGPSRGWFVWHSFDRDKWEAVISRDPPGEKWTVKVLPWATTYRYLTYGVRPEELLDGERVNIFLSPSPERKHAYVCHFQDELSQMKGHNHAWQIRSVEQEGARFTASLYMGNEKKLEDPVHTFTILPTARKWHGGKEVQTFPLKADDRIYLTWCYNGKERVVHLLTDDGSLPSLKAAMEKRVADEVARIGMGGVVEKASGLDVQFLIFSTHWFQARDLKPKLAVRMQKTGKGYLPEGDAIDGTVVSVKPGGPYGSGPVTVLFRLQDEVSAKRISAWGMEHVLRIVPGAGRP